VGDPPSRRPELRRGDGGFIAVVTALPEELAPLLARLIGPAAERRDGARLWRGRLGARPVLLACSGDGNENALRGARSLLAGNRPDALIGAGVAGALTADLPMGSIVFGERVFDSAGEAPGAAPAWLDRARTRPDAVAAILFTADRVVGSADRRRELAARLPPGRPAAADLESACWARAAAEREVPFLALRAISDEAGEDLPELLSACQFPGGPIRRGCVARRALFRPATAWKLLELRRRVRRESGLLARFVESLLQYD